MKDKRLERLKYRSWHRGMREMDLLLGTFADVHLSKLTPEQLDQYETLLELPDPDFYNFVTGQMPFPENQENDLTRLLKQHAHSKIG